MGIGHKFEARQPGLHEKEIYVCSGCGAALFASDKKFDSGCGFPSFWLHLGENVRQNKLDTYGRTRIQLLCNHCGAHLGHLFAHSHTPTQKRYCINAAAITLEKDS
jgi:peptide-methionine (R)-S-oxide reductase